MQREKKAAESGKRSNSFSQRESVICQRRTLIPHTPQIASSPTHTFIPSPPHWAPPHSTLLSSPRLPPPPHLPPSLPSCLQFISHVPSFLSYSLALFLSCSFSLPPTGSPSLPPSLPFSHLPSPPSPPSLFSDSIKKSQLQLLGR